MKSILFLLLLTLTSCVSPDYVYVREAPPPVVVYRPYYYQHYRHPYYRGYYHRPYYRGR